MKATISILTFPQRWENGNLLVRILVMLRNYSPLLPNQVAPGTPAWVGAQMALRARLISGTENYPSILEPDTTFPLSGIAMPQATAPIFSAIDQQYGGITNAPQRLQPADSASRTKKYLPETYLKAANFKTPKTSDAVTDDSYRCAIRDDSPKDPAFQSRYDLSWGKVFAHCLRQPALGQRVGFIYEASIAPDPQLLKNGGWLYVELDEGCSYKAAMDADQQLVKRYAARLPKLKAGEDRSLFAAVQFPVLIKTPDPADLVNEDIPLAPQNLDEALIEAAQYDDGFCKVVHASQPVSSDLLLEQEDAELPVISDAGIRLAWDDEQLLIWANRQMAQDESLPAGRRTDLPTGVMQYRVDVRRHSDEEALTNPWSSLCLVHNRAALVIGGERISAADTEVELGVEVYPARPDARADQPFWLPQYFAYWIGKSLVLPDSDAINIFKKNEADDPVKRVGKNELYISAGLEDVSLLYGNRYDFRVRLADICGGGPTLNDARRYGAIAPEAVVDFRRTVQPQAVRISNKLPERDTDYYIHASITMRRPLLGYPSIVFTGKYANTIQDFVADTPVAMMEKRPVGLPDPDVEAVEVTVEIKALEMDMLLRYNTAGRESWAGLYRTKRLFPAGFADELTIPITWVDAPVIHFTDVPDLGALGLGAEGDSIDNHPGIVLPTSRDVRITLRPVVAHLEGYYAKNSELPRKGKPVTFITRKASSDERSLFKPLADVEAIRGIWLQPDSDTYLKISDKETLIENNPVNGKSSMVQRLVEAIDKTLEVEAKGMSIMGKRGYRIQFGASRLIRHNLSPDSTSITFASKADLLNQWIVPLTVMLNRDWTWDGCKPVSFNIWRKKKMVGRGRSLEERNATAWGPEHLVGDIEMKQAINVQALYNPERDQTLLCFLDAVEPKPESAGGFPEEMMVEYRIEPIFKSVPDATDLQIDNNLPLLQLHLPITNKPAQVPRVVSAGIAQSPYKADERYSSTEPRRRHLWIEFAEPLQNKDDAYFIRMLAYAPDPLLAQLRFEMLFAPQEPSLPINEEDIRIIAPGHTDDKTGLNAMQQLVKATDSEVHYLVPLPPGMHAASPELFGFFTYEIRVGHKVGWTTAQARFGSPFRTTGVQHPSPQLFCTITRNEKHIMVSAPFAQTVFNGANVTSNPPRTALWALLYAQVARADGKAHRNVLLDDQLFVRKRRRFTDTGLPIVDEASDGIQYGITGWKNKDVEAMLYDYGLPEDSPLSVLVVEMLPTYDKFYGKVKGSMLRLNGGELERSSRNKVDIDFTEGMMVHRFQSAINSVNSAAMQRQFELESERALRMEEVFIDQAQKEEQVRPLTENLGDQRILRTSTLVAVPKVCCIE